MQHLSWRRATDAAQSTSCLCLIRRRLLSMPYAMRLSGWCGLAALSVAAALFCISGKLIVSGFDRIPHGKPHSYSQLGEHGAGSCLDAPVAW